jgi:hypothetical protein
VNDAVERHATEAYLTHLPSHFAIDLLNGLVAHLERSCRHVRLDPTQTRQLLDAFIRNALVDIAAGARADREAEEWMVKALKAEAQRAGHLPPVGPDRKPAGYMDAQYWRRVYDRDMPDGSIKP